MMSYIRSYELEVGDKKYTLQRNMFKIKRYQKTVHGKQ